MMSDQNQNNDEVWDIKEDIEEVERSDDAPHTSFQNALDFVDAEIDALNDGDISELPIEALVALVVLRIVEHPQDVRLNITRASRLVVIELDVNTEDLGKVIGKQGHTVDAIRSIARSAAGESSIEYDIVPLEKGKPPARSRRRPRGNYHNNWSRHRRGYRSRGN
ncbi:MAG: KH domain-containing protein [bacterium]